MEVEDAATCKKDILTYLKVESRAEAKLLKDISTEIKDSKYDLFMVDLINKIANVLGFEERDRDLYLKYIASLEKYYESAGTYEFLYQRLIHSITEDNWSEIYRLGEILGTYALLTDDYYEKMFESINISSQGIVCVVGGEDQTATFRQFFDEELENILSKGKVKEKSKK